jgi:hypothetical protein
MIRKNGKPPKEDIERWFDPGLPPAAERVIKAQWSPVRDVRQLALPTLPTKQTDLNEWFEGGE